MTKYFPFFSAMKYFIYHQNNVFFLSIRWKYSYHLCRNYIIIKTLVILTNRFLFSRREMYAQHHQFRFVLAVFIIFNIYGAPIEKESSVLVPDTSAIYDVSSMMYIDRLNTSFLVRQHIQIENNTRHIYISPLALFDVNQTTFIPNPTTHRTLMKIPLILYTDEQIKSVHENNLDKCKQNRTECLFHEIPIEAMGIYNNSEGSQPSLLDCYNRYIELILISHNYLSNQHLLYVTFECVSSETCYKFEEALHQSNNSIGFYLQYATQELEQEQMIISDKHLLKTKIHLSKLILISDVEHFLEELLHAADIRDNDEYFLLRIDLKQLKNTLRQQLLGKTLILTDENNEKQWNSIYWKKLDIIRPDRVLKLLNERVKSRGSLKNRIETDTDLDDSMDNYVQQTYDTEGYDLYLKYRHLFVLRHTNSTQGESTSFLKLKPILAYRLNKFNRSSFLVHQPVRMTKHDNIHSTPIHSILPFKKTQSTLNRTDDDLRKLNDLRRIIDDLRRKLANYEANEHQSQTTSSIFESKQ